MWSVHTRNETTSRWYPPEVHADLPSCVRWPRGARRGPISEEVVEPTGARSGLKGATRGHRAARRLALYGSHVGVGDVGALRLPQCCLVLSHTQGVSRPHILLLDAARRGAAGPQNEQKRERKRGERPRERFHEVDLRVRASERAGERPRASRDRGVLLPLER